MALHARIFSLPPPQVRQWTLQRPDGRVWTVLLTAQPQAEQREALASLLEHFGLLTLVSVLLLGVTAWHVKRSFRPLDSLLHALTRAEESDLAPLQQLRTMPTRELDAIAAGLERSNAERRLLARKVLTLQEDERERLARELHDEFGQRLTALRVDAAWLARRVSATPELGHVVQGMAEQIEQVQRDIRGLLQRLQPLGPAAEHREGHWRRLSACS